MRIITVKEESVSIASEIKNAHIDFRQMTVSAVALVTDVVRNGRPVTGYGFDSNGRFDIETALAYGKELEPLALFWYHR